MTRNNWEDVLDKRAGFPRWISPLPDEPRHKALFRRLAKHTDAISYLDSSLVLRVDTVSESVVYDKPPLLNAVVRNIGLAEVDN